MEFERVNAYATPIWTCDLAHLRPLQQVMIDAVLRLRAEAEPVPQRSTYNGWHSDGEVLNDPPFHELRAALFPLAMRVLKDYGVDFGDAVFGLSCWANVHDRGGYNASHFHPGAWLSGSFYLKVPDGAGRIYFEDPRPAARLEHMPRKEGLSADLSRGKIYVQPREMTVVLFPGWLEHGVEVCGCEQRISLAFNVSPVPLRKAQLDALTRAGAVS